MTKPDQKRKPHPIVDLAFGCMIKPAPDSGVKDRLVLDPKAGEALERAFKGMKTPQEREDALVELVAWGHFMSFTGSPSVLGALRDLLAPLFGGDRTPQPSSEASARALKFLGLDTPRKIEPAQGAPAGKKWWEIDR